MTYEINLNGGLFDVNNFERLGPDPIYQVRLLKNVKIPMRDGISLSTDFYFPEEAGDELPIVYMATPYQKNDWRSNELLTPRALMFAGLGYVVAIQDLRGCYESEGQFLLAGGHAKDGYDTVDCLSQQFWSNGKIGTFGCSYMGEVQVYQARLQHPKLCAMIPNAAGGATGSVGRRYTRFAMRIGGAFCLASMFGWMAVLGNKIYNRNNLRVSKKGKPSLSREGTGNQYPEAENIDFRKVWHHLPTIDFEKKAGIPLGDFKDILTRDYNDPWWSQFDYLDEGDKIDVPTLHVDSWYDTSVAETIERHRYFSENAVGEHAKNNQFLIISPMEHCRSEYTCENTIVGKRYVGDARYDHWQLYLNWFDHWLKGMDNGVTREPKIKYFVMGRNEWHQSDTWPIPGTRRRKFFLLSDGNANSRFGTGKLSENLPDSNLPIQHTSDCFVYDPGKPVPSVGGPICATATDEAPAGSFDQQEVEKRRDVLVYTTPVLTQGIEVTGPIKAILYVSSTARDTDFTTKLVDVYPDSRAYNVQEGILRMRYRDNFLKKVWMEPERIYRIEIDMQMTSNYFKKGHCIRLEIASSNFPRFDRNLNTGGNNYDETVYKIAENTVHHSKEHTSCLLLPIVPCLKGDT